MALLIIQRGHVHNPSGLHAHVTSSSPPHPLAARPTTPPPQPKPPQLPPPKATMTETIAPGGKLPVNTKRFLC